MKQNRNAVIIFILLIIVGAGFRLIDNRPLGFAPQIAMAIFAGAVIKDKKWAFAIPLFSMLVSDILFEIAHQTGLTTTMVGFYPGQWLNYILMGGMTLIGIAMKRITVPNVAIASLAGPIIYFLLSNFFEWTGLGGLQYTKTLAGLALCYESALPFFKGSLAGTACFSALFFGTHYFIQRGATQKALA